MKVILENMKLILTCVTSLVAVIGLGWYAKAHMTDTYVEDREYTEQCAAWKNELELLKAADVELEKAIAGVSRQQMINSIRQDLAYYKRMIDQYHYKFGQNCERCQQFDKDQYWFYRREYDRLLSELRRLGG